MKICKNVQVYGIERIIFDKVTEYELSRKNAKSDGMWYRTRSPRNNKSERKPITNQQMAKGITCICNTREYEVGFNGNTAHIDTITNKRKSGIPRVYFISSCIRHGD